MKSNVAAPRTVLVDNSWMVEVSSLDLLLNINHDKVRARVIELLLLFLTKTKKVIFLCTMIWFSVVAALDLDYSIT